MAEMAVECRSGVAKLWRIVTLWYQHAAYSREQIFAFVNKRDMGGKYLRQDLWRLWRI